MKSSLPKNHRTPLNVTRQAQERVFVGLGWDPKEGSTILENVSALMTGKELHHDLDLSCYIYDPNETLIDIIGVETQNNSDKTNNIYHSGDSIHGIGDGDDEQISVELKDINPDIAHIIFAVTIKSGHSFDEIETPEIRLADGYSERVFVEKNLNIDEAEKQSGYAFVRLYLQDGVWMMHYIDAFFKKSAHKDLGAFLKSFINDA